MSYISLRKVGIGLAICLLPHVAAAAPWSTPDINTLADDDWGRAVRRGQDLVTATPSLIGPEVEDPARRLAGNNLSCQNCHLKAGTVEFALPLIGVFADFPQYRAREGKVGSIEDRINGCMTRSLNGRALPPESEEMRDFVAYMKFLSTGIPVGSVTPGRGSAPLARLDRPADPIRGAIVYRQTCTVCHGLTGEGRRQGIVGDTKGYTFPPLWGPDSFSDGAGMARIISAVSFIHSNMPIGTTWQKPVLTGEDSWDVAAFIESQPRPHMANLDRDFPNRLQKPVDAAYGPYLDPFSAEQHRYGPFTPIESAVANLRQLATKLDPETK